MTKTEIKEKRAELVRTILAIEKLKDVKSSLTKALAPDFEVNEAGLADIVLARPVDERVQCCI